MEQHQSPAGQGGAVTSLQHSHIKESWSPHTQNALLQGAPLNLQPSHQHSTQHCGCPHPSLLLLRGEVHPKNQLLPHFNVLLYAGQGNPVRYQRTTDEIQPLVSFLFYLGYYVGLSVFFSNTGGAVESMQHKLHIFSNKRQQTGDKPAGRVARVYSGVCECVLLNY